MSYISESRGWTINGNIGCFRSWMSHHPEDHRILFISTTSSADKQASREQAFALRDEWIKGFTDYGSPWHVSKRTYDEVSDVFFVPYKILGRPTVIGDHDMGVSLFEGVDDKGNDIVLVYRYNNSVEDSVFDEDVLGVMPQNWATEGE